MTQPRSTRAAYLAGRGWTPEQIAADRGRWAPDLRLVLTAEGRRLLVDAGADLDYARTGGPEVPVRFDRRGLAASSNIRPTAGQRVR
jgi:hypothetical protein